MNNLITSIMSRITTGPSAFYNDVSGRVYLDLVPEDEERQFPDAAFFIVADIPDNCFAKLGEEVMIQFSLFSASSSISEMTTMYADLKALFDDVKLTVTSNTMFIMKRERLVTFVEDYVTQAATQRIRHWAVDYTTFLQAT